MYYIYRKKGVGCKSPGEALVEKAIYTRDVRGLGNKQKGKFCVNVPTQIL
jgi:hypothetical protein